MNGFNTNNTHYATLFIDPEGDRKNPIAGIRLNPSVDFLWAVVFNPNTCPRVGGRYEHIEEAEKRLSG